MHRIRGIGVTMTHATTWNARATGEAPSPRCSAVGVGPDPHRRCPSGRGGPEFGLSLVADIPSERDARAGRQTHPGTPAATVHRAEASTGEAVDSRGTARRVPDRSLDAAAGDRIDSPAVRRALSPRACLEGADHVGLELPEARAAGGGGRRGRHRPAGAGRKGPRKKKPRDAAPPSPSAVREASYPSP